MENQNEKYWAEMTVRSSVKYCREMLRLSANPFQKFTEDEFEKRCQEYIRKVIRYDREHTIDEHLTELMHESPFPDDICGYIHEYSMDGVFQPMHLMCKIATIRFNSITFEFLIEYGMLESDVEIYYGVKAISDQFNTTDEFAKTVIGYSERWFDYIRCNGQDTQNAKDRSKGKFAINPDAHKFTNNISNGTFWISWVRKNPYDSLNYIVTKLKNSIYANFKLFLMVLSEGDWRMISDADYDRFADVTDILNQNLDNGEEKYPYFVGYLDEICSTQDQSIIEKRPEGYYQFRCDNFMAKVFIEYIFNPQHFKTTLTFAKEYWGRTKHLPHEEKLFIGRIKEELKNEKHWYSGNRKKIDREWVRKTFRAQDGSMLLKSFFTQTIHFNDRTEFIKIKEVMVRLGVEKKSNIRIFYRR